MAKRANKLTMSELLRQELRDADSLYGVAKATGVHKASLIRFLRGETSLRLDIADALAEYFGLELKPTRRRKG